MTTVSKKEEFLLQAITHAREELMEEADAWFEGADPKTSRETIQKIVDDLLHCATHFEEVDTDEGKKEECPWTFNIGQVVRFISHCLVPSEKLFDSFGITNAHEKLKFPDKGLKIDSLVQVIDRKISSHIETYLVSTGEGKRFFVRSFNLKKFEVEPKFQIGDTVAVQGVLTPVLELYEKFGYDYSSIHFTHEYDDNDPATVISYVLTPSQTEYYYHVQYKGKNYFAPEIWLKLLSSKS